MKITYSFILSKEHDLFHIFLNDSAAHFGHAVSVASKQNLGTLISN